MSDPADPRAELAEITRQARAWVEWVADSGVAELPSEGDVAALLGGLDGRALRQARPSRARSHAHQQPRGQQQQRNQQQPRNQQQGGPQQQRNQQQHNQQQGGQQQHAGHAQNQSAAAPRSARPVPNFAAPTPRPAPQQARAGSPGNASLSPEERRHKLTVLADEVANCTNCRLHESRTKTAFGRGNSDTELVFVGEGPGRQEDLQGIPFVGQAGQLLDRMIGAMGYQRDEVYICNIVKCRPPNNRKPEPDEMKACMPYLERQLALIDPKAIVTLGATGAQGLLNIKMGVTRMRGVWKLYRGRIPLMPTFHPAYLLRQPAKKRDVWSDLQQVMKSLGKSPPSKKTKA